MARQHRRKGTLSGVLALIVPAMMSHGVTAAQEAQPAAQSLAPAVVAALWRPQEISFYFHSFNTFYPCPSLNDKVRRLLLVLGANSDIRVRSSGCEVGYAVARSSMVRINLSAPAEVTPELLAELEKTRTTRELIARARGERAEAVMDATAQFPAAWQRISLDRRVQNLNSGDCDLIDAIKRQVLPQLSVRIVNDNMRCGPYQYSSGPVRLEVEVLTAMPAADAIAQQKEAS